MHWLPTLRRLAVTAAVLLVPTGAGAAVATDHDSVPKDRDRSYVIEGEQVFPEGITTDRRYVYATSKADGTVYRGRLGSESLQPFLPAGQDGLTTATGIKSTGRHLLVAGAETGRFFVYGARDGQLVARYVVPNPGEPTFLNDVVVTRGGDVYITDSLRPAIYRIPAEELDTASSADGAERTLQTGATLPADSYTQGFNANGIVATPDGRALLVVYTNSGALYRVDLRTGTTAVAQLDRPLLNGDGLELRGHTLYVARNVDNLITTVRLSGDYTAGATIAERSYPGADVPTTLALSRGRLLVVNSQFDTLFFGAPQTSETFTISSIPLR